MNVDVEQINLRLSELAGLLEESDVSADQCLQAALTIAEQMEQCGTGRYTACRLRCCRQRYLKPWSCRNDTRGRRDTR